MENFQFPNKYKCMTHFLFREDAMTITEYLSDTYVRSYDFLYADICQYAAAPASNGFYRLQLSANGKKIRRQEDGKISYCSMIYLIAGHYSCERRPNGRVTIMEDENSILRVIRRNTPLRSRYDELCDIAAAFTASYESAGPKRIGTVYITGPFKKFHTYDVQINGITRFSMDSVSPMGAPANDSNPNPYWVSKDTFAFSLPFGEWDIAYSFAFDIVDPERTRSVKETAKLDAAHIVLDAAHPVVKLRKKNKLFGAKLVEV